MTISILSARALNTGFAACILLLLVSVIQAQADSPASGIKGNEQAENTSLTVMHPKGRALLYITPAGVSSGQAQQVRLTTKEEYAGYSPFTLPYEEEKLTVNFNPQPANGHSGDIHLTFNLAIAERVEITIQDMRGRILYQAFHPAENRLVLHFGHDLPILTPGSYQFMAVSDKMADRRIFVVQ